ncbi:MAG: DUF72 domain-containing protein [Gemmatimonadota bacterium]|nr:MAG: DUF72 domain-containing protein [Gemmatimonadota bacterium]
MNLHVGTSGYSYKEWKGSFYPAGLGPAELLRYYSQHFDTVEINSSFYRMPTEKTLIQWEAQVPERFVFVLKASRRITHLKRLNGVEDELSYLLNTVGILGGRLGPLLFQLPPNMKKDTNKLVTFLRLLSDRCRAAIEFRNKSWFDDDVYDAMKNHNTALVYSDSDDRDVEQRVVTADFGYLRLRRERYEDRDLEAWRDLIKAQPWKAAFVFFKHEDDAAGPRLAKRLLQLW